MGAGREDGAAQAQGLLLPSPRVPLEEQEPRGVSSLSGEKPWRPLGLAALGLLLLATALAVALAGGGGGSAAPEPEEGFGRPVGHRASLSAAQPPVLGLSSAKPGPVPMRGHRIRSEQTGRCMDWTRVIVDILPCDLRAWGQLWHYEEEKQTVEAMDHKCLDAGGDQIHVWNCSQNGEERWKYDVETGQIHLGAKPEYCLEEEFPGVHLHVRPCDPQKKAQRWSLHSKVHRGEIKHQHGLCLDAGGSMHMWHCDTSNGMQHWRWDPAGPLEIVGKGCLDAQDVKSLRPCNASKGSQQWLPDKKTGLVKLGDAKGWGSCLAAPHPEDQGSEVRLEACNAQRKEQQWLLQGLEEEEAPSSPRALLLLGTVLALAGFICAAKYGWAEYQERQKAAAGGPPPDEDP